MIGPQRAIVGLASGAIAANAAPKYLRSGQLVTSNETEAETDRTEETSEYYVTSDITTSFMILVGGKYFFQIICKPTHPPTI